MKSQSRQSNQSNYSQESVAQEFSLGNSYSCFENASVDNEMLYGNQVSQNSKVAKFVEEVIEKGAVFEPLDELINKSKHRTYKGSYESTYDEAWMQAQGFKASEETLQDLDKKEMEIRQAGEGIGQNPIDYKMLTKYRHYPKSSHFSFYERKMAKYLNNENQNGPMVPKLPIENMSYDEESYSIRAYALQKDLFKSKLGQNDGKETSQKHNKGNETAKFSSNKKTKWVPGREELNLTHAKGYSSNMYSEKSSGDQSLMKMNIQSPFMKNLKSSLEKSKYEIEDDCGVKVEPGTSRDMTANAEVSSTYNAQESLESQNQSEIKIQDYEKNDDKSGSISHITHPVHFEDKSNTNKLEENKKEQENPNKEDESKKSSKNFQKTGETKNNGIEAGTSIGNSTPFGNLYNDYEFGNSNKIQDYDQSSIIDEEQPQYHSGDISNERINQEKLHQTVPLRKLRNSHFDDLEEQEMPNNISNHQSESGEEEINCMKDQSVNSESQNNKNYSNEDSEESFPNNNLNYSQDVDDLSQKSKSEQSKKENLPDLQLQCSQNKSIEDFKANNNLENEILNDQKIKSALKQGPSNFSSKSENQNSHSCSSENNRYSQDSGDEESDEEQNLNSNSNELNSISFKDKLDLNSDSNPLGCISFEHENTMNSDSNPLGCISLENENTMNSDSNPLGCISLEYENNIGLNTNPLGCINHTEQNNLDFSSLKSTTKKEELKVNLNYDNPLKDENLKKKLDSKFEEEEKKMIWTKNELDLGLFKCGVDKRELTETEFRDGKAFTIKTSVKKTNYTTPQKDLIVSSKFQPEKSPSSPKKYSKPVGKNDLKYDPNRNMNTNQDQQEIKEKEEMNKSLIK